MGNTVAPAGAAAAAVAAGARATESAHKISTPTIIVNSRELETAAAVIIINRRCACHRHQSHKLQDAR